MSGRIETLIIDKRLINNGDDISQKIQKYLCDNNKLAKIKPILNISFKIKFKDLIDNLKTNDNFSILKENIIDKNNTLKNSNAKYSQQFVTQRIHSNNHSLSYQH